MKNQHILSIASVIIASAVTSRAQTNIVAWDFDAGGAIAAPYNSASATTGAGTATELGMGNSYTYSNGEGPGSSAAGSVGAEAGASTGSGSFAWKIVGNSNNKNAGTGKANGWNTAAPIGTQGAEFAPTSGSTGYDNLVVTLDVFATTQAPANFELAYTLNGTTWINATLSSAGAGTIANNTTSASTVSGSYIALAGNVWNNQITADLPAAADNDANFAIEFVNASTGADDVGAAGGAYNNNSGNIQFDNVVISGTALPTPEPTSLALIGIGATALVAFRKSRKA